MSADGTGTGVTKAEAPSEVDKDLAAIYTGGENFLARMKVLRGAREAAEKALGDLALGNSIRSAVNSAERKQQESSVKLAQAEQAIAVASSEAEKLIAEARTEAKLLLDQTNEKSEELRADSIRAKAEAEEEIAKLKKAAKDDRAQAASLRKAAEEAGAITNKAKAEAEAAAAEAEAAKKKYDDLTVKLQDKLDRWREIAGS